MDESVGGVYATVCVVRLKTILAPIPNYIMNTHAILENVLVSHDS